MLLSQNRTCGSAVIELRIYIELPWQKLRNGLNLVIIKDYTEFKKNYIIS